MIYVISAVLPDGSKVQRLDCPPIQLTGLLLIPHKLCKTTLATGASSQQQATPSTVKIGAIPVVMLSIVDMKEINKGIRLTTFRVVKNTRIETDAATQE